VLINVSVLSLFLDCRPVVDRQLLTFLCFAKEIVSKRKATADLPFGCPFMHYKKWEMNETRFAQTAFISDPFSAAHKRLRLKRSADQGQQRDYLGLESVRMTHPTMLVIFLTTQNMCSLQYDRNSS
jgi:hypothetical protein